MKELLKTEVPTETTTPLVAYVYEVNTARESFTFYFKEEIPAFPVIDAFLGVRWLVEETNLFEEEVDADDFCEDDDDCNTFKKYGVLVRNWSGSSKNDTEEVFKILERNNIEKLIEIDKLYGKYLREVVNM